MIVDSSIAITGGFRAAANAAVVLADHADVILVLPLRAKIDSAELAPFSRVIRLPLVMIRRSWIDLLLYLPALLFSSLVLRVLLARRATHIVLNDFVLMHGALLRLLGFRGFVGAWVRINPDTFPRPISRTFLKLIWLTSDRVFVVGRHMVSKLPAATHVGVLYDFIAGKAPAHRPVGHLDRNESRQVIAYVANYIRGKGQQYAVAAFAKIAGSHPDAQLHFWGGDMGLAKNKLFRAELGEAASATGLSSRIFFHGFADRPAEVLSSAYLALMLSDSETLSYSCIEASMAGVPVVATRCGGPEEIVVDGRTGFLVPPGDVDAISAAMSKLLGDRALAGQMGSAGAEFAKSTFSAEAFRLGYLTALGILPK